MKKSRTIIFIIVLFLLLGVGFIMSIAIGSRNIPVKELIDTILGGETNPMYAPIIEKRLIRTVLGLIAGCALSTAGCLMQSITRNPIADPSILGVNTGASLAVVIGIAFFGISTAQQYIWTALVGAAIISIFVFGIASFTPGKGSIGIGNTSPIRLALAGAATSTACSSLISTIMLPRTNVMSDFRFWQVGSIRGDSWSNILSILPFIVVGMILAISITRALNVLALGDEVATGLGVNTRKTRIIGAFAGVLLCGATTAITGPIGFVGLMIPHLVRIICGGDLRVLIPLSSLGGAVLLIFADVLGRILGRPGELEVGIVTVIIGAPLFIDVVRKAKVNKI